MLVNMPYKKEDKVASYFLEKIILFTKNQNLVRETITDRLLLTEVPYTC